MRARPLVAGAALPDLQWYSGRGDTGPNTYLEVRVPMRSMSAVVGGKLGVGATSQPDKVAHASHFQQGSLADRGHSRGSQQPSLT